MPKSITLHVVRKTKVRTKPGATVHQWRSDWKTIYKITYDHSKRLFKCLNGKIETEAEFCNYIKNTFGTGIYFFRVWKKGQEGFRNFLMVELENNRFRRIKASLRKTQKHQMRIKNDLEKLKEKKKQSDLDEKEILDLEIEIAEENLEELKGKTTKTTKYPYPYLKSAIPVYAWHSYESVEQENINEEKMQRII